MREEIPVCSCTIPPDPCVVANLKNIHDICTGKFYLSMPCIIAYYKCRKIHPPTIISICTGMFDVYRNTTRLKTRMTYPPTILVLALARCVACLHDPDH